MTPAVLPAAGGVRPPAVAGSFYPQDPERLGGAIAAFLSHARPIADTAPIALVVPHAGYVYAGQIMADAWAQAAGADIDVIVILGTDHTQAAFDGVSVYDGNAYATPLGKAPLDRRLIERLLASDPLFVFKPRVHAKEHSIEVQVPFAQTLFPHTPLVCAVVGRPDLDLCARAGHALAAALDGHKALIVASSDLSHYPDHDTAVTVDRETLTALATLHPEHFLNVTRTRERQGGHNGSDSESGSDGLATCACGKAPIMMMMTAARDLGAKRADVISYANSGDTSLGERGRCVGYGAVSIRKGPAGTDVSVLQAPSLPRAQAPNEELNLESRTWLLRFARETLQQFLSTGTAPLARDYPPELGRPQGAFVTLSGERHRLRGCIGHIPADTPLAVTVGQMAIQAALRDPRFAPVRVDELASITIEISALSPPRAIEGPDAIVLGRDGVILQKHGQSAVFLPQVAGEQGWSLEQMLSQLSIKAGLPSDAWRHGARFETFQAEVFHE